MGCIYPATPLRRESSTYRIATMADDGSDTGGSPDVIVGCTDCNSTYPAQLAGDGYRPIGTDGTCDCGNDEFEPINGD